MASAPRILPQVGRHVLFGSGELLNHGAFSYSGTELEALAGAKNYYRWILSQFHPYVGRRTIGVGAGIGTISELLLAQTALDQLIVVEPAHNLDAVESKLFGIGSESYVVGSHEFYLGYALLNDILLTLDSGHFHPTETISDKLSAILLYLDEVLLHVSRGVRWDSDHVVTLNDDLQAIMQEIVRGDFLDRVHIGLDFFDASVNRIAAWAIGARNALRALLMALLEPVEQLRALEAAGDYTQRLALLEELKGMPSGAVWDYYCLQQEVPVGLAFMEEVKAYEKQVLAGRE